ncbi:MAG: DUF1906 domain-containing protein [Sporichthyaceae bacterium]
MRQRPRVNTCASHRRDRAVNALAVILLTGGAATAVLLGPDAAAGPDRSDKGPAYPAGASVTHFKGLAFDTCIAPTAATMQAWLASPYRAIGVYTSGTERACRRQPNLTRDWVAQVSAMGWKIVPIDVGRQAPCRTNLRKKPIDPKRAEAQGAAAARRAVDAATSLGILPGSALYSDIEHYRADAPRYRGTAKGCRDAVADYISAWTKELHRNGYLAGMYGHVASGTKHAAARYENGNWTRPDAIWTAQWDRKPKLKGWPGVASDQWANRQRIKQYRGDHLEKHGGVVLNIDSNLVDAPVATVAGQYPVAASGAAARRAPRVDSAQVSTPVAGGTAAVLCKVQRRDGRWYKLTDGSYLPQSALAAGATARAAAALSTCAYPAPVQRPEGTTLRAKAAGSSQDRGRLPVGALAWVECRNPDRPSWLSVGNATWVNSDDLATGGPAGSPLPRCEKRGEVDRQSVEPAAGSPVPGADPVDSP